MNISPNYVAPPAPPPALDSVTFKLNPQEVADLLAVVGHIGGSTGSVDFPYEGTVRDTTEKLYHGLADLRPALPSPQGDIIRVMLVSAARTR